MVQCRPRKVVAPSLELITLDLDHHLIFNECVDDVLPTVAEVVRKLAIEERSGAVSLDGRATSPQEPVELGEDLLGSEEQPRAPELTERPSGSALIGLMYAAVTGQGS